MNDEDHDEDDVANNSSHATLDVYSTEWACQLQTC